MQHKKHTRHTALSGKDSFSVTVNPNVDYAFIASLVVLFDVIDRQESAKGIGTDNFEAAQIVQGLFQWWILKEFKSNQNLLLFRQWF